MSYMYDKVKNGKFSAAPEMCCSSKLGGWGGGGNNSTFIGYQQAFIDQLQDLTYVLPPMSDMCKWCSFSFADGTRVLYSSIARLIKRG